ncbi:hypothetical protein LP419_39955 [Massilia sp. H-1]|nr:hypothetical protein LP419_39955 [Massilia sp. H-1]
MAHSPARILMPGQPDTAPGPLEQALAALGHAPLRLTYEAAVAWLAQDDAALLALDAASAAAPDLAARIAALRAGLKHTPLIVLAPPASGPDFADAAYAAGALDVLSWPLWLRALRAKLDFVMQTQQQHGPAAHGRQARQAEEQLRQSEERYRTLFDSVDDGVCVIDVLYDGA